MESLLEGIERVALLVFLVAGMLARGLGVTPRALAAPFRDGRRLLATLGLNFVVAPVYAWVLSELLRLERSHAIAMLLLGLAAGAPFLPKLVEAARGDRAFAISTMTLLTVGTIVFMPIALPLLVPGVEASPWSIARPLVCFILAPLAIGMGVGSRLPRVGKTLEGPLGRVEGGSLALLLIVLFALHARALPGVVGSGAIAAAFLHLLGLFAGGWLLGAWDRRQRGTLALGAAFRNYGAAFVPAAQFADEPGVAMMLTVSVIVGVGVAFPMARWVRRATAHSDA